MEWKEFCSTFAVMCKKISSGIILLLSFLVSGNMLAQVQTPDGKQAIIEGKIRLNKTVHDFGDVLSGSGALSCKFMATNISNSPLVIYNVVSSCGCTNVKWTREPLQTGKYGYITATYDNNEGPGSFDKTLTVYFSGVSKPVVLHLRGAVHAKEQPLSELYPVTFGRLGMKSTDIKLGNMHQGSQKGDAVSIANLGESPISLTFTDVTPGLELNVSPNPIPAGSKAELTYIVTSDRSFWGKHYYYATPLVNGRKFGSSKIGIWTFTKEDFSGMSKEERAKAPVVAMESCSYSFGVVKAGTKVYASYTITNTGKSPLKIYSAGSDNKHAVPQPIGDTPAGGKNTFKVTLDTTNLPKGETTIVVMLTTNAPDRPVVNLYISGAIQ